MATIVCNYGLDLRENQEPKNNAWSAKNGATRRQLVIVNKTRIPEERVSTFKAQLAFLDKGNHSFIFINPPKESDDRKLGLYVCSTYGYQIIKGKPIYENSSSGGPGNSESKFGIYEPGTILEINTYRNRQGQYYVEFTGDEWKEIPKEVLFKEQITEV